MLGRAWTFGDATVIIPLPLEAKRDGRLLLHSVAPERGDIAWSLGCCCVRVFSAVSVVSGEGSRSGYRWYILTLAALTHTFVVAMPTMCMPVLFEEISEDLDLSLVQIGTVWGIASLAGAFVVLSGGLLGDRFGPKVVLVVACFLAGLAGALRGLSGGFVTLTATFFLFGLLTATIPPIVHKTCGVWFSGRRLGLANGVASMGMAVGFTAGAIMSATILSPLLDGWRNVLFLYGAISVIVSVLWLLTRGEPGRAESSASYGGTVPFRQALSGVVRIRDVWLLGFVLVGQIGCVQGMLGYLPLYLRDIGWTGASADGALAAFHATSMVGVIPIALLSDRLGSRKSVLLGATLMTAIGVGLLSVAGGAMVWVSVVIAGIVRDAFMAVLMSTIIETAGVGAAYAGTAMGLVLTLSRLSASVSPPIGNSLADVDVSLPFVFWAALAAVALLGFYLMREERTEAGAVASARSEDP
jgi:cyanate permease